MSPSTFFRCLKSNFWHEILHISMGFISHGLIHYHGVSPSLPLRPHEGNMSREVLRPPCSAPARKTSSSSPRREIIHDQPDTQMENVLHFLPLLRFFVLSVHFRFPLNWVLTAPTGGDGSGYNRVTTQTGTLPRFYDQHVKLIASFKLWFFIL